MFPLLPHALTVYNSEGFPLTVQQHAREETNRINAPEKTKMYGATLEYSTFNSKYLCNSTCIQIPAQKIANPDACTEFQSESKTNENH